MLLEEIKRLGDNEKVLLGEFLTEVSEMVPQNGSQGSSPCYEWVISKPGVIALPFYQPGLSFSCLLPFSWEKIKSGVLSRRSVGLCMQS